MTRKQYRELAARSRVPLGFVLVVLYMITAQPSWPRFLCGAAIGLSGILLRAWATGHLEKNQQLCTSGPYAYTRNPLYLGSAIVATGFALAGGLWSIAMLYALVLQFVYWPVVLEEESHLRKLFPGFADYAQKVPRFWPTLVPQLQSEKRFQMTIYKRNQEYNALIAYLVVMALLLWKLTK